MGVVGVRTFSCDCSVGVEQCTRVLVRRAFVGAKEGIGHVKKDERARAHTHTRTHAHARTHANAHTHTRTNINARTERGGERER
jgi:hypothetical protein